MKRDIDVCRSMSKEERMDDPIASARVGSWHPGKAFLQAAAEIFQSCGLPGTRVPAGSLIAAPARSTHYQWCKEV